MLSLDHSGAEAAFAPLRPKLPEKERGQPADEWLFNVFATAALRAAADGGAWRRDAYLLYTYSILTRYLLDTSMHMLRLYLLWL